MKVTSRITIGLFCLLTLFILSSYRTEPEKPKVGFLVHDLVSERWEKEMNLFAQNIIELGGEPVTQNAFGDANTQVTQGKELIDRGIKVIAVVAQDAKILAQLVDYANQKGATIIAYDRLLLNCDLPYYFSFNSVMVGEQMASYALNLKPKGNYVILNGPSSDNNAALVKQGVMNKLKPLIDRGDVKVLLNQEMESWNALPTMLFMEDYLSRNKTSSIDAIIAASDDIAAGALEALNLDKRNVSVVTGQDASVEACSSILQGKQSMTVFKDGKKLPRECAILAMKLARGEKIATTTTVFNGKANVPSILFDPVVVDKNNLRQVLVPHHITEDQLGK